MKIQAKDIVPGQTIYISGVKGKVIDIKESFLKNGTRVCNFLIDCPERKTKLRGAFSKKQTLTIRAKRIWTDCRETTLLNIY